VRTCPKPPPPSHVAADGAGPLSNATSYSCAPDVTQMGVHGLYVPCITMLVPNVLQSLQSPANPNPVPTLLWCHLLLHATACTCLWTVGYRYLDWTSEEDLQLVGVETVRGLKCEHWHLVSPGQQCYDLWTLGECGLSPLCC
jgi:hypothetical protein